MSPETEKKKACFWRCSLPVYEQPEFCQHMEAMETLPQPDELAQYPPFTPVLAGAGVEVELCSPQNPVTHPRVEVVPVGRKRGVQDGQTRTLSLVVTEKAPVWNVRPGLTRCVSKRCRWAWPGAGTCWVVVTGQALKNNCPGRRRASNRSRSHLHVMWSLSLALGVQQSQQTLIPTLPSMGKWGGTLYPSLASQEQHPETSQTAAWLQRWFTTHLKVPLGNVG